MILQLVFILKADVSVIADYRFHGVEYYINKTYINIYILNILILNITYYILNIYYMYMSIPELSTPDPPKNTFCGAVEMENAA